MSGLSWAQQKGLTASSHITGESPAPAIACALVFGLFAVASIANWIYTRYEFYEVLTAGAIFRMVAYSCKAAALYKPEAKLEGVSMTFLNSGLGATIAVICISLGNWFRFKEAKYFSPLTEKIFQWTGFLLCIPIIIMGPGAGIAGSVLVYSGFSIKTLGIGFMVRMSSSLALCIINGIINIMLMIVIVRVFRSVPDGDKRYHKKPLFDWKRKNSKLVILLLGAGLLLQIRAITGVFVLWYSSLWNNDTTFYLLDGFPEMLALSALSVPTLLARCAQFWPPDMREMATDSRKSQPGSRDPYADAMDEP